MITIMKKYENPMLQVVSIKENDVIVTSPGYGGTTDAKSGNLAPGMREFDDYYEGY